MWLKREGLELGGCEEGFSFFIQNKYFFYIEGDDQSKTVTKTIFNLSLIFVLEVFLFTTH